MKGVYFLPTTCFEWSQAETLQISKHCISDDSSANAFDCLVTLPGHLPAWSAKTKSETFSPDSDVSHFCPFNLSFSSSLF